MCPSICPELLYRFRVIFHKELPVCQRLIQKAAPQPHLASSCPPRTPQKESGLHASGNPAWKDLNTQQASAPQTKPSTERISTAWVEKDKIQRDPTKSGWVRVNCWTTTDPTSAEVPEKPRLFSSADIFQGCLVQQENCLRFKKRLS